MGPGTFSVPREHAPFRLRADLIDLIHDIACGVEEGDSGLKSCSAAAISVASAGASAAEVNKRHHHEIAVIEDEDECFDAIGDLLFAGFTPEEVASKVRLGGGATHLLALERWCDRVGVMLPGSPSSKRHELRQRARRALRAVQAGTDGQTHLGVLHTVYGWPDPFVRTLPIDIQTTFGLELAPLARFTDAVETKRQELVHLEAARRTRRSDGVVSVVEHRERLAHAERCLTSGDALRAGIAAPPVRDPDESIESHRERLVQPHRTAMAAFLLEVKLDANRMLTAASQAFRDAWSAS
jgi:hypothetical protein